MIITVEWIGCIRCGKCCWNWKENKPEDKCEYLADDMKTCRIHGEWEKHGRPECREPIKPHQIVDLPPECPYVAFYRK